MRAFLAGKMHVDDVPLIRELMKEGLVAGPTYVPAWYHQMDTIDAMFTHSATMNRFDVAKISAHYENREKALESWKGLTPTGEPTPQNVVPIEKAKEKAEGEKSKK